MKYHYFLHVYILCCAFTLYIHCFLTEKVKLFRFNWYHMILKSVPCPLVLSSPGVLNNDISHSIIYFVCRRLTVALWRVSWTGWSSRPRHNSTRSVLQWSTARLKASPSWTTPTMPVRHLPRGPLLPIFILKLVEDFKLGWGNRAWLLGPPLFYKKWGETLNCLNTHWTARLTSVFTPRW